MNFYTRLSVYCLALFSVVVTAAEPSLEPVDLVDPCIDSAHSRWFFFSAACRPFGMINPSPDMITRGSWRSGYRYQEDSIRCISHIHAWQLSGIPVMPTTGPFRGHLGMDQYKSRYTHDTEIAEPGYHAFDLLDYDIRVELTSTVRTALHRYRVGHADSLWILFDLGAFLGHGAMIEATARQAGPRELEGMSVMAPTGRRPRPTPVYFVARFRHPFSSFAIWNDSSRVDSKEARGPDLGCAVRYMVSAGQPIYLKVAISYVDIEGARRNMNTEMPHWDFDRVRAESRQIWNDRLSRISVSGGTRAHRIKFYTDLWHALLGRRIVSDVDGRYADRTGSKTVIRRIPRDDHGVPAYNHHNSDALWGAQWGLNLLWPLVCPDVMQDFCRCFLDMYNSDGLIPRGPSGGNYTFVMIGDPATPFMTAARFKGICGFDAQKAYQGLYKNAFPGGIRSRAGYEHEGETGGGIEYYIERGYVPLGIQAEGIHVEGAGQTLEYAYQDWCLAQLAGSLGHRQDSSMFFRRSRHYRHLWNPETGFMRPRTLDGSWLTPFDPLSRTGWVEGNAWQYTWYVPHDVQGLIELMGGRKPFLQKLETALEHAQETGFSTPRGKHGQSTISYGNQPCTATAHLFTHAGAPWLTQKWVRAVHQTVFGGITPSSGYGGDEDQGQMGALSAMMAIGLFDMRGGCDPNPVYEITTPVFDRIEIHLDDDFYNGNMFAITTENQAPENIYIQSATLDGEPLTTSWFRHSELVTGGHLHLILGPEPNRGWASAEENAPPSLSSPSW